MCSNEIKPLIFQFNTINSKYDGALDPDLELELYEYGSDALEIKLINRNYQKQKASLQKQLLFLILTFNLYGTLILFNECHLMIIDIMLLTCLTPIVWQFWHLIKSERIIFCYDLGMHLQVNKLLNKQNSFIRFCHIHDIVINEVLENLDFRYLLIIRTKGELFYKNPIIPIFKVFKPTCECLTTVQNYLNKIMTKE